jgi:hypothetical protein
MEFVDIPTEQTTAATDAVVAFLALVCGLYLQGLKQYEPWKANLWSLAFGLLTIAATLGAVAHGFKWSAQTWALLWQPLNLALGLTIALFVVGVVYDVWGKQAAWRVLPVMLAVGVGFFVLTLVFPGTFLVFVLYQAVGMLFALISYGRLALQKQLQGAWLMVAGVLVTMIASGVQTSGSVRLNLIWQFDHNGVFHLIQMVGLLLLTAGLSEALRSPGRRQQTRFENWGQE